MRVIKLLCPATAGFFFESLKGIKMRFIIRAALIMVLALPGQAEEVIKEIPNSPNTSTFVETSVDRQIPKVEVEKNIEVQEEVATADIEEVVAENIEEEIIIDKEDQVVEEIRGAPLTAKVVVIAKRIPTRYGLNTATLPYSVISGGEYELSGLNNKTAANVIARYEDIHLYNMSGSEADQFILMRGFSEGTETAVFVDGVKYNAEDEAMYWYWLPLESFGRYELTKGADSSVYGSGGFAGTVHFYRKKQFDPYVKVEMGGFGYGSQTVGASLELGRLYGSAVVDHRSSNGFRRFDNYDLTNIDLVQGVYLNENKTSAIEYGYQNAYGITSYADQLTEEEMAANRFQAIAGDKRKTSRATSYLRYTDEIIPNLDISAIYNFKDGIVNFTNRSRGAFGNSRTISQLNSNGLALQFDLRNDLLLKDETWTSGLEDQIEKVDFRSYALNAVDWSKGARNGDSLTTKGQKAIFISYQGTMLDRFVLNVGGRQDSVHYDYLDLFNAPKYVNADFSQRTHHIGVFWKLLGENGVFANYRQAFKAPGYSELFNATGWGSNNPKLTPELAKTSEAGVRWKIWGGLQAQAALYRTIVDDEILWDPISFKNQNLQKTLRDGVDASIGSDRNKKIHWRLGYAQCKARIYDSIGSALDGKIIPVVPEYSWNLSMFWEFMPDLSVNTVHEIIGQQYKMNDSTNDFYPLPAYHKTDLQFKYAREFSEYYLAINNLFNSIYETRGTAVVGFFGADDIDYYVPAAPRAVIVGFKYLI